MSKKLVLSAVCAAALLPVAAHAAADFAISPEFHVVMLAAKDARYKLTERKAGQALDLLKDLRNYAGETKDRGNKLKDDMRDNSYEDWVNTKLLPSLFQAKALEETLKKTYDLEKSHVSADLKTAKGGNYGPIDETIARINAFVADYEAQVKAVDGKIAAVKQAYDQHFGNAKRALAEFDKLPIVQELLAAKPALVKKTKLDAVKLRPIEWAVVLEKQKKEYNDPRFKQVPTSISILDGQETRTYSVIIR